MVKVVGVRFKDTGKMYYFDPGDKKVNKGDYVVVETARGVECGIASTGVKDVPDDEVVQPLKPIMRIADDKDVAQHPDGGA